jgi:hypothetical protein
MVGHGGNGSLIAAVSNMGLSEKRRPIDRQRRQGFETQASGGSFRPVCR